MLTERIIKFLNVSKPPQRANCLFVLAGKQERKVYGVELWRQGHAPELILSVARFEWRRFYDLGLPADGGLKQMVAATPPPDRHFFVRFHSGGATASLVRRRRYGTLTEALGLAQLMKDSPPASLLVISSSIHLRRARLVFCRFFRKLGTCLTFVAVPENPAPLTHREVFSEFCKYLYYRAIIQFF